MFVITEFQCSYYYCKGYLALLTELLKKKFVQNCHQIECSEETKNGQNFVTRSIARKSEHFFSILDNLLQMKMTVIGSFTYYVLIFLYFVESVQWKNHRQSQNSRVVVEFIYIWKFCKANFTLFSNLLFQLATLTHSLKA